MKCKKFPIVLIVTFAKANNTIVPAQKTHFSHQELKVIEVASRLFMMNGVKNVTVDDIAKALGMSKKTIYHLFDTKAKLVSCCVDVALEAKRREIKDVAILEIDPISEMLELGKLNVQTFKVFSKNTLGDLQRFYPEACELIDEFKEKDIYQHLLANLNKGVASKDYRDNLQVKIVAHIYIGLLDSAMMQHSLMKTNISLDEVYKEHLLMHIYSICSDQGRAKLESHLKNIDYA